ncbi:MAG: CxxC-x17-CxxC domain-containing protein [Nanoarchaeota archaeon]|nr:CxxC-x17-CxxC domain-containing protein [Nanoarchaeota archaeon]
MARFERSRERKSYKDYRDNYSKRDGQRRFEHSSRGRRDYGSRESSNRYGRDRRDLKMTKVICSSCGAECEVPFKPTSSKPVYCDECFAKKNKAGSNKIPNQDLDIINEKLNKIMKALKIE